MRNRYLVSNRRLSTSKGCTAFHLLGLLAMTFCLWSMTACSGGWGERPDVVHGPANLTVIAGQTATFSVAATGTAPLSYQWSEAGVALKGATGASYTTQATTGGDNGEVFSVTVTNAAGEESSASATLTVDVPPVISVPPTNQTVIAGQTATFSVVVSGTAPLNYQWSRGGVAIAGATGSSYTTPVTSGSDNSAVFIVTASNMAGTVTSASAILTVNVPPTITLQPVSDRVDAGATATFNAAATGTAPMSYQWYRSGAAIAGATGSSYTTATTQGSDDGAVFTMSATNIAGTVTSAAAALHVNVGPTITLQPASQTLTAGQTATLNVAATGSHPMTYQWYLYGAPIAGATSNFYTTAALTGTNTGAAYTVAVTNVAGKTMSATALLTVNVPPTISAQASAETVIAGQVATFSVAAMGTAPMSYQWFRSGTPIAGATSSAYSTAATVSGDSGALFTVTVTNVAGSVTSATAALTVNVPPSLTAQPVSQTVAAGQTATFHVAATGTAPLSYQWFKNGAAIAGATSRYYTTSATVSGDNGSVITATVTNVAGNVTSAAAGLTVNVAPTISAQPVSETAVAGQPATFSVVAAGTAPFSYQWSMNGAPIGGATSSSYTDAATTSSQSGALLTVAVTNAAGTVASAAATLTVNTPPSITAQPVSEMVISGQSASYTVAATGTAPLSYQWLVNGAPIGGATSSSYTTAATVSNQSSATYSVTVTNAAGTVTSAGATLTVNTPPSITLQPASASATSGQTAAFSVTATGTAPLAYQWFMNGAAIGGATSGSYTTAATTSSQNGALYTVTITNVVGTVTSAAATLTVNTAPAITAQPVNQTVTAPQTAVFNVAATGTGPLSYQWYLNGAPIGGATSSSYTTPTTAAGNNGAVYMVKVTNTAGSVTSTPVTMTVYTTPLATGIICNSLTPPFGATITVVPNFSGGTATIGTSGFGSSDVTASAVSGTTYTTSDVAGVTTFTMTVTGSGGAAAVNTCTATPTPVTIAAITPAAQTVAPGPLTFGATAAGGATNNLTWSATGGSFSGDVWTAPNTAGTYTITATSVDDPTVHVTTTATVSVPVITSQPVSKNACVGYNPSLMIGANYASSYQWMSLTGGVLGSGTSSSTMAFMNVTTASNGNYSCSVTNGAGSVTSNVVTLNVVPATTLTITTQPSTVSVYATQTATFSVAASGTGVLKYQWYTGAVGSGTAINGATSSTYTTPSLTTSDNGSSYYVTVTDPDCTDTTVTSTAATVTVSGTDTAVPPTIVVQPTGGTATVGGTATLSVTASGSGTLNYQWYRVAYSSTELSNPTAGVAISNANSSSYTVPANETAQSNDGDNYYVVVTNEYGSALSNRAVLAVGAGILLQITAQPQVDYVADNTLASFSVGATCTGCIPAYQWYWYAPGSTTATALSNGAVSSGALSGAMVAGATTSSLTLQNVPSTTTNALFYVVVTSTSDGSTKISGTNPLTSSTAGLFVGSLGTVGNTTPGEGLCNSSSTNWVLNGNTPGNSSGDVPYHNTSACTMELTNDQGNEHAAVYWPTLISTAKFSVSFTVTLSANSETPADGFTMVLADPSQGATTSSLGVLGYGIGADGIPGFIVGFDTYQDGDAQGDPGCMYSDIEPCDPIPVPYMAVGQGASSLWENPWSFVNGDLDTQHSTDYTPYEFANSAHNYVVSVVNSVMTVTMDGHELFTGTVSLPPAAYLGFTASTGGSEESVTFSNLTATVSAP